MENLKNPHAIVMSKVYDRMAFIKYIEDQKAHPENYDEFELAHPDLSYKVGSLPTYFEERNEDGTITKAYKHDIKDDQSCMVDITAIKVAEQELAKQESQYQKMLIDEARKQNA